MARLARIVIPAAPHHATQRGNRRQPVFFGDDDYLAYLDLLREYTRKAGVAVWASGEFHKDDDVDGSFRMVSLELPGGD